MGGNHVNPHLRPIRRGGSTMSNQLDEARARAEDKDEADRQYALGIYNDPCPKCVKYRLYEYACKNCRHAPRDLLHNSDCFNCLLERSMTATCRRCNQ